MDLEQLRQLDAIERAGTISAAADALHMTQPTLSRSVRRLEAELGQPLFERTHNRVTLNDAGNLAVEHARVILADERRMRDAFDELARRQRTLRVLSVAPAPVWRLTRLAVEGFPGVILESDMQGEESVTQDLLNGRCDLAITLRPVHLPTVSSVALLTEDLYLSAPAGHPLASRSSVGWADLNGEPFLLFEQIGFWMDVCRRRLPDSQLIVQKDRTVFEQLVGSSGLCCFTTNQTSEVEGRANVPLADSDAHATFFLCVNSTAPQRTHDILRYVRDHDGLGSQV